MARKVLVYSCSGCSSAAQMANRIAIDLDRTGIAEMSCIAGIGGGVRPLIEKAKAADTIVVLDGCKLRCAEHCLNREGLASHIHYDLSEWGIRKRYHEDFDPKEAGSMRSLIEKDLASARNGGR
ncbi:MAG: hypothetical protein MOGMAGMI_02135 [Candidatus Omnitrophica bacterium]|nr:hypothetical protein [Candidatus Omnitrophota bacterium]